jgi:23S rRNA pseudouridine1911/1915/1917 synthase
MTVPTDPPRILLEDGPLMAVEKPAGLPTQALGTHPSLENWLKDFLREKYAKPGNVYLGVPHRLDRPVSGIVVFAKNSKAAARLAEQFRDRVVKKIYWAVLAGLPTPSADEWSDWLRKIPDQPRGEIVPEGTPGAKLARLRCRVLGTCPDSASSSPSGTPTPARTLVEVELLTGRMHQIRLQSAGRDAPVWGDVRYGGPPLGNAPPSGNLANNPDEAPSDEPAPRILLHARSLELLHPVRYDAVRIECPPPAWWPSLPELTPGDQSTYKNSLPP